MVANSIPIRPIPNEIRISQTLKWSGAAYHRPQAPTTYMSENSQTKGMRWPALSATAPSSGARTAISMPAVPIPKPQTDCAAVPLPRSSLT